MRTLKKKDKIKKIFLKYSKNGTFLTINEMKSLIKKEFKLKYNNHVINSLMNMWGKKNDKNKLVIELDIFRKLFKNPDGFFRNINI
tara:strand:+ start:1008 stop:1265 length:258 start_codon:yes stop_codon:yes gene_type:complete